MLPPERAPFPQREPPRAATCRPPRRSERSPRTKSAPPPHAASPEGVPAVAPDLENPGTRAAAYVTRRPRASKEPNLTAEMFLPPGPSDLKNARVIHKSSRQKQESTAASYAQKDRLYQFRHIQSSPASSPLAYTVQVRPPFQHPDLPGAQGLTRVKGS